MIATAQAQLSRALADPTLDNGVQLVCDALVGEFADVCVFVAANGEASAAAPDHGGMVEPARTFAREMSTNSHAFTRLDSDSYILVSVRSFTRRHGVLALGRAGPGRVPFGADHVDPITEVGQQIAAALEYHESFRSERIRRSQAERRHRMADALGSAMTTAEVGRAIVGAARDAFGAHAAALGLVDSAGHPPSLSLVASIGFAKPFGANSGRRRIDERTLSCDAIRGNQIVIIRNSDEIPAEFGAVAQTMRASGKGWIGIPLELGGLALGAITLVFDRPIEGDVDWFTLSSLGALCSQALGRARAYDRQHDMAMALQRSLMVDRLPAVAGVTLSGRYLSATSGAAIGGDWFDAIPLDGNQVVLVVGDVSGHGVRAAAVMGQLRSATRALSFVRRPAELLELLDRYASTNEDAYLTTVAVAVIDVDAHKLTYSLAGHPPPLVARADGHIEILDRVVSLPLGAASEGDRHDESIDLDHGDSLLLYTDGAIERRGVSLDEGLDRLVESFSVACSPPQSAQSDEVLSTLVERLGIDSSHEDDIAFLLVQLRPTPSVFKTRMSVDRAQLQPTRQAFRSWLGDNLVDAATVEEVVLAFGEAAANAVEHSYTDQPVDVFATIADGELRVDLRDHGRWTDPSTSREGGRGLLIIRSLMDHVDIRRGASGTALSMRRNIAENARR